MNPTSSAPASPPAAAAVVAGDPATGGVVVDDEPPPRRVRRPGDALLLVVTLAVLGVLLGLAAVASGTAAGLESDIEDASARVPTLLTGALQAASVLAVSLVPLAICVDHVVRGQARVLLDALVGALLAAAAAAAVATAIQVYGDELRQSLTVTMGGGARSSPLEPTTAAVAGFLVVADLHDRVRWRAMAWLAVGSAVTLGVLLRGVPPLSAVAAVLVGAAAGLVVRYALGVPSARPSGEAVAAALARVGVPLVALRRRQEGPRVYDARAADGRRLDVRVLDRDQQGAGALYRLYRSLRLREQNRAVLSTRQALEREALVSYAAASAGAAGPRLVAVTEVGPSAALLAYEHLEGVPLDRLPPERLDDALLRRAWGELGRLHGARIAHRTLLPSTVRVDGRGRPALVDLRHGEVAAGELALRLDVAQLLVTLALAVGADRAARSALEVLGPADVTPVASLLQPIALPRRLRLALGGAPGLLPALRERLLAAAPHVEPAPVRLERLRPRTVLSVIGGTVAAYLLLTQLGSVDLVALARSARPGWMLAAVAVSLLTYLGSALSLTAFTPGRLPLRRTLAVQVASSFINLVTPPAVGNVALNARYLQRSGVDTATAAAAVGLTQLSGFVATFGLLLACGLLTGQGSTSLVPGRGVLFALGVLTAAAGVVVLVPPVRRTFAARLQPRLRAALPRLLDVLQQPGRLATGVGGNVLIALGYALALAASLRAFGAELGLADAALVYLAGSAIGSAAPTPGGLGAVEAALAAGLTAAGVDGGVAVPGVLLFRVLTFWARVLPGWLVFRRLQRQQVI